MIIIITTIIIMPESEQQKRGGVSVCSCDPGSVWVTQDAHLLRFTTSSSSRKRHPATLVPTQGEGGGRRRRWIPSIRLPALPTPHPPLTPASLPLPHTHTHTHHPSLASAAAACVGLDRTDWSSGAFPGGNPPHEGAKRTRRKCGGGRWGAGENSRSAAVVVLVLLLLVVVLEVVVAVRCTWRAGEKSAWADEEVESWDWWFHTFSLRWHLIAAATQQQQRQQQQQSTGSCDQRWSARGKMTIKFVVTLFTLLLAGGARWVSFAPFLSLSLSTINSWEQR